MNDETIKLSVRSIVEFVLRQGSIDSRYTSSKRAVDGTKIHQIVQKRRIKEAKKNKTEYLKEVVFKHAMTYENINFIIEGRADGVIIDTSGYSIEEIKSTLKELDSIENAENHWHWAQAKFYAFFLAKEEKLDFVKILLTYCNVETKETLTFENSMTIVELQTFFYSVFYRYFVWVDFDNKRKFKRNLQIKDLNFPHENFRKGQRDFSANVYTAIKRKKRLFAQAPTGTGKTMSTIFPSIKAMGEGLSEKIFYLTAKTITRQTAEETMRLINSLSCDVISISLTAKEKICINNEMICNPTKCKYAHGHFDRVNDAVFDILQNEIQINRDIVQHYSQKHSVCPHEFALDICLWVDIIICDYNYVFDPKIQLKRFFEEGNEVGQNYVFLVDEAHNLVDRSREMYSKLIFKKDFSKMKRDAKTINNKLHKSISKIDAYLLEMRKTYFPENSTSKVYVLQEKPLDLYELFFNFSLEMDKFLATNSDSSNKDETYENLLEQYFRVLDFVKISDLFNEKFIYFLENKNGNFSIKILCLDPSDILDNIQKIARTTVFFSATLTPIQYFANVFSGNKENSMFLRIESPFSSENFEVIASADISTVYRNRGESYLKITKLVHEMAISKVGNYFVFFSSYEYLLRVYEVYTDQYFDTEIIIQNKGMTELEKEDFLKEFEIRNKEKSMIAFAVMGGMFSEGIDLVGEKLIGVAIVGVGLPLITEENDIISKYYSANYEKCDGFDFAYVYPGMNKVLQSAGRLIRSETDSGIILLIDQRFCSQKYLELFPQEWKNYIKTTDFNSTTEVINQFWSKVSKK